LELDGLNICLLQEITDIIPITIADIRIIFRFVILVNYWWL